MRGSIYPPCNTPPYQCSRKASFLGLRSIWETGNPGFYLDVQHTLLSCPSSDYHIYSPLWLLLTASLQESWLILCQCVHVCTLTCTCMQVCMHMSMCEHVQVRGQHQVSSSITFPLIFGTQSLTKPGMVSSARLGDQWTWEIWLPLLLQPWDYRQLPIQPSFDVGTGVLTLV